MRSEEVDQRHAGHFAIPSSCHWWPQLSQVHSNLWTDSAVLSGGEARLLKITSCERHTGQHTAVSGISTGSLAGSSFGK